VFFTVQPPDECFIVKAHVDAHGSGPLVFGPSTRGADASVAVCAPDYSIEKEEIPPEMVDVFTSDKTSGTTVEPSAKPVHVVSLSVLGGHINLPSGCWHTVRSYGCSIRVSYYFGQRTAVDR